MPKPNFDDVLECMDRQVVHYAAVTDNFDDALDAAWDSCEALSYRATVALRKWVSERAQPDWTVSEGQQMAKRQIYDDYRGTLVREFLDANAAAKGGS